MPLKFVQIWEEGLGWRYITASEAAKMYPDGVSSSRKIFRCSLCKDWATLTHSPEGIQTTHFRHERAKQTALCEQRSIYPPRTYPPPWIHTYDPQKPRQDLKIIVRDNFFSFSIGLRVLPHNLRQSLLGVSFVVKSDDDGAYRQYDLEKRLIADSTTYFPVPSLSRRYSLSFLRDGIEDQRFSNYWGIVVSVIHPSVIPPNKTNAINDDEDEIPPIPFGIFDAESGKLVPKGGDIVVGKRYYLLTTTQKDLPIDLRKGFKKTIRKEDFILRDFVVRDFDRNHAVVFEKYFGYKLTGVPPLLFPIWPPCAINEDRVVHSDKESYLFAAEEATVKASPPIRLERLRGSNDPALPIRNTPFLINLNWFRASIVRVTQNGRQLVSLGRQEKIKELFFWPSNIKSLERRESSTVMISSGKDELTENVYYKKFPQVDVQGECEGKIEIEDIVSGRVVNVLPLSLEGRATFSPKLGERVCVYQGRDLLRVVEFLRPTIRQNSKNGSYSPSRISDDKLRRRLDAIKGNQVAVPHSFGSLVAKMDDFPLVKKWVLEAIRTKKASSRALKLVQSIFGR